MLSADRADPGPFIGRIHAAYRRAALTPRSAGSWTITPPAWWRPTRTVDQRRALTADERRRFLAIRRQVS